VDSAAAARVGAAFEALLLARVLEPLAQGAALGSFGTTFLAQTVAERDVRGFGAAIALLLERGRG
jgi:hypothetical protein